MVVPNGVVLIWAGLNNAIPTGYSRFTTLDGQYTKGANASTDPSTGGGASTHTHTSSAHSHSMNDHTHTYTTSSADATAGNTGSSAQYSMNGNHYHTGTTGSASGGGLSSVAATYDTVSNDPPYYSVIFIQSNGTKQVPNNVIALYDKTTAPTSWKFCDGANSTPDLRNKYLKGATTGADAGSTGGSTTNVHDLTHTHTVASHTHGDSTSSTPVNSYTRDSQGGSSDLVHVSHTHTVSFNSTTVSISASTPSLTTSETVEPAYTKLAAIQNQSGIQSLPRGIIGLWFNTLASIPRGWVLCDGQNGTVDMRSRHLKICNSTSEIGNTGGSNTHTHASQTHTHTATGTHTHSGSVSAHVGSNNNPYGSGNHYMTTTAPNHTLSATDSATAVYADASTTADSSSNEPPYTTALYIQFQKAIYQAGVLAGLL